MNGIIEKLGMTPGPIELVEISGHNSPKKLVPCKDGCSLLTTVTENTDATFGAVFRDADARVFAAATEMLEALIEEYEFFEAILNMGCMISGKEVNEKIKKLLENKKQAIEKATGKSWPEIKALLDEN